MCAILHRRRQRGKLHAIGRMTHSDATQTFAGLDSLASTAQDDSERYLTANGTRFVGMGVEDPSSAYAAEVGRSGSRSGGGGGGRRDSGSGGGGAFKEVEMEVVAVPSFNRNFNKKNKQ